MNKNSTPALFLHIVVFVLLYQAAAKPLTFLLRDLYPSMIQGPVFHLTSLGLFLLLSFLYQTTLKLLRIYPEI